MKKNIHITAALVALIFSSIADAACNANITAKKPDSIYIDHGNGTVTDKQPGLMWMQCTQGLSGAGCSTGTATAMNWKQALEAAQSANNGAGTAGYTDWRLPMVAELRTLVEEACDSPAINATLFPATVSAPYWSASPYAGYGGDAGAIDFRYSTEGYVPKHSNYYVRLVRGGQ